MAWRVDRVASGDVSRAARFYRPGTYYLLKRQDYTTVYRQDAHGSTFLGYLGSIELPDGFPAVTFPPGVDQIVVTPEGT